MTSRKSVDCMVVCIKDTRPYLRGSTNEWPLANQSAAWSTALDTNSHICKASCRNTSMNNHAIRCKSTTSLEDTMMFQNASNNWLLYRINITPTNHWTRNRFREIGWKKIKLQLPEYIKHGLQNWILSRLRTRIPSCRETNASPSRHGILTIQVTSWQAAEARQFMTSI